MSLCAQVLKNYLSHSVYTEKLVKECAALLLNEVLNLSRAIQPQAAF